MTAMVTGKMGSKEGAGNLYLFPKPVAGPATGLIPNHPVTRIECL